MRVHESIEPYHRGDREIIPLSQPRGHRRYFHSKPYILEPEISLSVDLYQQPAPDGSVGQVAESRWEGLRHQDIGQAQAWYYPDDATLVLWECYLHERYQNEPPIEDALLGAVWRTWEHCLLTRCPEAQRIATPSWEPLSHPDHWREFLAAQGYQLFDERAYLKEVVRL